ncbi:MAG: efflux RND transporter periplasmic adaptor subunit [Pontiellaceae bacterium]|nr:efflux RND transporter periplasmic adaptor subunit [Pontiellaceae bacterium]
MNKERLLKVIGPALLMAALLMAAVFMLTTPEAEQEDVPSIVPVVEWVELQPVTTAIVVQCMGTVIADREAGLEAEVSGRITGVQDGLVEGSRVRQGDVLITIDPRDYELALEEARAALQRAESSLRLEEGSQAVSKHEMDLIGAGTEVDAAYQDLMLRKPQLQTAQANVTTAKANLAAAQLKLDRTQIRAPFDAWVQAVNVSEGDMARSGKILVKLVALDRLFVRASLPVSSLAQFPAFGHVTYPARITLADGVVCEGSLHQMLPDLSDAGRMARVLIEIFSNAEVLRPLLLGEVATVEISGQKVYGVCLIDRTYLRDGPVLWMMSPDERLHVCPAELVQGYADTVLVRSAFSNDWKLITSDIPAPVDGMQLRVFNGKEGGR